MALTTVPASLSATALTLTTAAQPNITSVGTLTGLAVTGNATITKESPTLTLTDSSSSRTLLNFVDDNNSVIRASGPLLLQSGGAVSALTLDASRNATFTGDVTVSTSGSTALTLSGDFPRLYFIDTAGSDLDAYIVNNANGLFFGKTNSPTSSNDIMMLDLTNQRVGIGESSPSAKIHVKKTAASTQHYDLYATTIIEDTEARLQLVATDGGSNAAGLLLSNETKHWGLVHHGTGNSNIFSIGYHTTSSNSTDISDNLSDILNITTGGRVGIGHTSPNAQLHINAGNNSSVTIGDTTNPALQIGGTTNYRFGVYTDGETAYIENKNGDDGLAFRVKTAGEAMRIDGGTGRVGIGDPTPRVKLEVHGGANEGIILKPNAQIAYSPSSSDFYNGLTFENSGSGHAYSIGYGQGGRIKFSYFDNSSTYEELAHIRPGGDFYPAGSVVLQSGEGINFSATGQATGMSGELLDDYEEGTWTPLLIAATTNPTGGGALNPFGSYTKVGNRVTVTYYVGRSYTNTPAGQIYVSGLPFPIKNVVGNVQYHYIATYNINFNGGMTMGVPDRGASTFNLYMVRNSTSWAQIDWTSHTSSPIYVSGSFSYIVD